MELTAEQKQAAIDAAQAEADKVEAAQTQLPIAEQRAKANTAIALSNPALVPQKFKNEDGSVDADKLLQSYLHLEQQSSGVTPTETQAQANTEATTETKHKSIAEALEGEKLPEGVNVWEAVEKELNETNELSEATRKALTDSGVPESMIAAAIQGRESKKQADMVKAYEITGGEEGFNSTMGWAKANLSEEERQSIATGLKGDNALMILQGLHSRAQVEQAGSGQVNTTQSTSSSIPAGKGQLLPFETMKEQVRAQRDPRYKTDPNYRQTVTDRVAIGAGFAPAQ